MVIPQAVIALLAQPPEETVQVEGDVRLVVHVAIGIAADLAAYHIGGRRMLLLPDSHGDDVLEVADDIYILDPMSTILRSNYEQGEERTVVSFSTACTSLSTPAFFVAAWSIWAKVLAIVASIF